MGSKSKSKSESGSAQAWAKPYATAAAGLAQSVYDQNAGNLADLSSKANDLVGTFTSGYNSAGNVGGSANNFYNTVLGGKYLTEGNPYLQAMIDATNSGIIDNVNSQFSLAGRYGSGAQTGVLTSELAKADNALRYQNYSDEMQRMMDAASGSTAADSARAQAQAAAAQTLIAQQQLAAELPYTGIESLSNSLGTLFNGGTSTQKQSSGVMGGLGGIMSGLGTMGGTGGVTTLFSDRRLKKNIERIGQFADGLPIYEFDYLWDGERQTGVMADEVAEYRPWALGPEIDGYATVNIGAL